MASTAGKVQFGLSNVHFTPFVDETGSYDATAKAMKGAVTMSLEPEGESSTFNADNVAYFTTSKNSGYTGTLEVAYTEKEFLMEALGYEYDEETGLLLEFADNLPKPVAITFEIDGNVNEQGFVLYNVTFNRPSNEFNTTEDTVEPTTISLDFTAIGHEVTYKGKTRSVVKGVIENTTANAEKYQDFFTKVVVPTAAVPGA